ncbi:putative origin recognition complex subunit 5 [Cryptosporidium felis]|nr:putative origin recognition complex subunit 5 [Cryptosporidium felis]
MNGEKKRKRANAKKPGSVVPDENEPDATSKGEIEADIEALEFSGVNSAKDNLENLDFNESVIQSAVEFYPEEIRPTVYSLCKKYGNSRFEEIFQLVNTIGSQTNSVPYLQVLGMPGTGKHSIVMDLLKKNGSVYGFIDGTYAKWLSHPKGSCMYKISVENLFVRPVEKIRKKLIKKNIFCNRRRKTKMDLLENELEDSCTSANSIIEFIDELRLISREYVEFLQKEGHDEDEEAEDEVETQDSTRDGEMQPIEVRSRCIFLVVKNVTTISKHRPDLLLTLIKLHEHLRDTLILPVKRENILAQVNFSVVFIDNYGIPEDFFSSHSPFPIIWFSSYNEAQCFDILANIRINKSIKDPDCQVKKSSKSIVIASLQASYRLGCIEIVDSPDSELSISGIKLKAVEDNGQKETFISIEVLNLIWIEFVAEIVTVLYPYLKSDFSEIIFKVKRSWPVFLLPLVAGEVYFRKQEFEQSFQFDEDEVHVVTQALLKRFKRHYNKMITNIYSHFLPELFQADLILSSNVSAGILNYGFPKDISQVSMPYFSKLLLVSAYVASKVDKKDDKMLFYNLVSSKLKTKKGRRRVKKQKQEDEEDVGREAFSLIRWLAVADCIALHITGSHGLDQSVPVLEQISDIVSLGFVVPIGGKWGQLTQPKGEICGALSEISPIQDLTIGQNIGIEMAIYRQNNGGTNSYFSSFINSSSGHSSKLTYPEPPINIEDPRTLYIVQAPKAMIETFSTDIGIVLKEIIPEC